VSFLINVGMGGWMDLKVKPKKGDKIVILESGDVFIIKYFLGELVVVNNGLFDFPLLLEEIAPVTPLMEELL
jgi:hypothetical protein